MTGARVGFALVFALSALATPLGAAEPAEGTLPLWAHWPEDLGTAMEEPIPLTTLDPLGEPDLSAGPATPGSSTAGTLASFTYRVVNPDGTDGPYGPLLMDPSRPIVLDFYLSADQAPWPTAAGEPPREVDHGVAPRVTVEATLRIGGQAIDTGTQTHDLVSAPEPVGTPVQTYLLELDHGRERVEPGEGLTVQIEVHQLDEHGEKASQPGWNVHTGEAHPTGIVLPTRAAPPGDDPVRTLSIPQAQTRETRALAVGVLVASIATAAVAGVRMLREL